MLAGLMPLSPMGVDRFVAEHPTFDGRGVIIGILDTGIDLGLPGFRTTTTGEPKVLDARDFSREGRITLREVQPGPDGSIEVGGVTLTGFSNVAGYASPPYYGGTLRETRLGGVDANDNRAMDDVFPVLVVRTASGWAVVPDGDGDGSLLDETPVHDYLVAGETFTWSARNDHHGDGPMTVAANLAEVDGRPVLDLFFDNGAHGSHVGGIAAGHQLFNMKGFNGVAPGAQILAVKIANSARGGITVTGSIVRAMNYAADFAQQRGRPLVLNLSFGVGNEVEGRAAIDSLVAEFALKHPDVPFVISAGNDGPGISTIGFPGSARHILSVCALFPGAFTGPRPQGFAIDADVIADFSSRGAELAKPDLCAPGVAYSNVPPWDLGNEVSGGTSMAAPQIAGAAALLQSARVQAGVPARAIDIKTALMATAGPARGGNVLDRGAGVPNIGRALEWLEAGHQAGLYEITAVADGGNTSRRDAAYRRNGFASPADTVQHFVIQPVAGQPAARLLLRSDQRWLHAPAALELRGGPATVPVTYSSRRLRTPGLYVGSVWATPASDTLAGPAFRLTSTVVVPQALTQPFAEGRDLGPGRLRRYFFKLAPDAGGLVVEMELRYKTQTGALYLFEPSGQPYRAGSTETAGGGKPSRVRMVVRAEDVIPGVWEVVVVAPPTTALSYELRAAIPRYRVEELTDGPLAVVRMRPDAPPFVQAATVFQRTGDYSTFQDSLEVVGKVIGARREWRVEGRGSNVEHVPLRVPSWARAVEVEVQLPEGAWEQYTDFGVTLFDSTGAKVGEGPLSYRVGRTEIDLRRKYRGGSLDLELFPAFAHLDPPETWRAHVQVVFLARTPVTLELTGIDTTQALSMAPGTSTALTFRPPAPDALVMPAGFEPVIEVTLNPAGGAPARRRRALH